jgi:hypothetical protein
LLTQHYFIFYQSDSTFKIKYNFRRKTGFAHSVLFYFLFGASRFKIKYNLEWKTGFAHQYYFIFDQTDSTKIKYNFRRKTGFAHSVLFYFLFGASRFKIKYILEGRLVLLTQYYFIFYSERVGLK